tara:strand:- start:97 stop:285 length:189 start_codon:yes stop_codon:yes gene_type:complete
MIRKVVSSTDGQFLGMTFNDEQPIVFKGFEFKPTKIEAVAEGITRFSNSNYVILAESMPAQN